MKQHCTHNIKVIDNAVDKKSKLYLQIIIIIDYMVDENLFVDAA